MCNEVDYVKNKGNKNSKLLIILLPFTLFHPTEVVCVTCIDMVEILVSQLGDAILVAWIRHDGSETDSKETGECWKSPNATTGGPEINIYQQAPGSLTFLPYTSGMVARILFTTGNLKFKELVELDW